MYTVVKNKLSNKKWYSKHNKDLNVKDRMVLLKQLTI